MSFFILSQDLSLPSAPRPHGGWSAAYRTHLCSVCLVAGKPEMTFLPSLTCPNLSKCSFFFPVSYGWAAPKAFLSVRAGKSIAYISESPCLVHLNVDILLRPSDARTTSDDQQWDRRELEARAPHRRTHPANKSTQVSTHLSEHLQNAKQ